MIELRNLKLSFFQIRSISFGFFFFIVDLKCLDLIFLLLIKFLVPQFGHPMNPNQQRIHFTKNHNQILRWKSISPSTHHPQNLRRFQIHWPLIKIHPIAFLVHPLETLQKAVLPSHPHFRSFCQILKIQSCHEFLATAMTLNIVKLATFINERLLIFLCQRINCGDELHCQSLNRFFKLIWSEPHACFQENTNAQIWKL